MKRIKRSLLGSTIVAGMAVLAMPAVAQTANPGKLEPTSGSTDTPAVADTAAQPAKDNGEIVVTGSLFRRKDLETPSPVTQLTAQDLSRRGITTVTDALQTLAANNGSNLPTAFSANGAFASGASGVSLRGLSTNSTLVLFDGLRAADYPLADDGVRSFVDINTIPDAIVDRIEVLKDGASSTYGADAVAGVVNVIVKKQIQGVSGSAEGGISQRGDAGHQRVTLTAGYGDLASQGFNVYVSGEYQHDSMLYNHDRGYPYNTLDLSRQNFNGVPGADNNPGANGVIASAPTTSAVVTPATETTAGNIFTGQAINGSLPQVLSPAGCGTGTIEHSSAAGGSYCEQNTVNQYGVLQPQQTRAGVTARGTVQLSDTVQAYLMGTYYQDRVYFTSGPNGTGSSQPTTVRGIVLPATLANGATNPQDPFANIIDAATGQRESALLNYNFGDIPSSTTDMSRTYRVAGGINGTLGSSWKWNVEGTYMRTVLDQKFTGLPNYDALQSAIVNGTYNFIDPTQNSAAERSALSPELDARSTSTLWQVQGTLSRDLFELPGGMVQLGVSGQVRYEGIDDPVQDPTGAAGDYSPYTTVGVNLFSAVGHRYNESGAFELSAPILKQLEVDASGRYDHYSEGFSHFSPKVGVKFTPIDQLILRGTFSKGFRAPSIPESSGQVIGYVNTTPTDAADSGIVTAHGNDAYVKQYSLGEFNTGNPNLKPELSTSFTGGAIIKPTHWLSLSADYYHIKKSHVIVEGSETATAIENYYAGTALPAGYSIVANPIDPAHPDALPTIETVNASFVNAASEVTSGIDFNANAVFHVNDDLTLSTNVDVTKVFKLNLRNTDGTVEHFVGTEGPYANTSDSGTPRWRGTWSTTAAYKKWTVTGTMYYTSGYAGYADDYAGLGCENAIAVASDGSTPEQCHVKKFIDVDATVNYQVTDKFSIYTNVINLFDARAPFDPNTYGGVNYNPAFAEAGVVGRFFKVGVNFKL